MSAVPPGARILLVAPQPFYVDRGTPMNVRELCRALTRQGLRVDLATYPMGRPLAMPGLRVHRAPRVPFVRDVPIGFSGRKVALDLALALRTAGLLLRRRYRAVHAVEESVFFVAPLLRRVGPPLVYDLDSRLSEQLAESGALRSPLLLGLARRMEALALRRARAAVTVCASLSETVRRLAPGTPVFQIEDAPLPEAGRAPRPERVEALRREWGAGGRRLLVYTGNLEGHQGIPLLVEAAERLRARVPEALWLLVGGPPRAAAAWRRALARRGLEESVRVVGPRPPEEMREWMALGELLVSPRAKGRNTPLKLYTYMASGVPILATRRLAHTQVLDEATAYLAAPTAEGLADAAARALADPEGARERARRARALQQHEYSATAFERKVAAAYAALLGGRGRAAAGSG